jgi:hypothetical protein
LEILVSLTHALNSLKPNLDTDAADPIPNPDLNTEADGEAQVGWLLAALEQLADNVTGGNRPPAWKVQLWDPDQFDGSDLSKLWGFLLQCKLKFRAKPGSFRDDSAKVNYVLSFLKGMALNYFEPFLIEDPTNEPGWLTNFEYFTVGVLVMCRVAGIVAPSDGFDRDPGFWLRDGGSIHKCRLRV